MPAQGRLGDKANIPADAHGCPACPHPGTGPAIGGSGDVNVNKRPALRMDDPGMHAACCGPNTWNAFEGSTTVFINGKPAHRMGDQTKHCGGLGKLIEGSNDVIVGGPPGKGSSSGTSASVADDKASESGAGGQGAASAGGAAEAKKGKTEAGGSSGGAAGPASSAKGGSSDPGKDKAAQGSEAKENDPSKPATKDQDKEDEHKESESEDKDEDKDDQKEPEKDHDLHFEFSHQDGAKPDGEVVLEKPDGTFERTRLSGGVLKRAGVAAGDYAVHFPRLEGAHWSDVELDISDGKRSHSVNLVVSHNALPEGALAVFTIFEQHHETSPIHQFSASLVEGKPSEELESMGKWGLTGLRRFEEHEHDAAHLMFKVGVGDLVAYAAAPMHVFSAPAHDEDEEKEEQSTE